MTKTTVYLPRELKQALARVARQRRCSEAELLREAVARITGEADAPAASGFGWCRSTPDPARPTTTER